MPVRLAAAALVLLALGGCSGGSPTGSPGPSAAGADAVQVWAGFVRCAREHGQSTWPDAAVDPATGEASWPREFNAKDAFETVRAACGPLLDRLPPQANPLAARSLTEEEFASVRRYAQCLRENGLPDLPDPRPDPPYFDPDYFTPERLQRRAAADQASCQAVRDGRR